jgi:molybdate transport system substrate-binding protein
MRALAQTGGAHPIGVTQITEILNTPGVALVGPLPSEFELATTYTAAVCTRAAAPDAARRLVALLAGAGSRAIRVGAGFEL